MKTEAVKTEAVKEPITAPLRAGARVALRSFTGSLVHFFLSPSTVFQQLVDALHHRKRIGHIHHIGFAASPSAICIQ